MTAMRRPGPYPHVRVRNLVVNASSRGGARPLLIVLHSTEGANVAGLADLVGLGRFFDTPEREASSHVAVDAEGNSARYVRDSIKAWTQANYNPVSLSIEQVGRAAQTEWSDELVDESARWVAYWSRKHGIPIQRGQVSGGRVLRAGVVTHKSLGVIGGGHVDPGAGFPFVALIHRARRFRDAQRALAAEGRSFSDAQR